jgi:agmatine deiminase
MTEISAFYQPAEWQRHRACWTAWPSHRDLWQENLPFAQSEFAGLCREISKSEQLEILVPNQEQKQVAEKALTGCQAHFHLIPFGDIWLRDTGAIFVKDRQNQNSTVSFVFNGWGGKYILPHDNEVSSAIAKVTGLKSRRFEWTLEGGAVDVDGQGTCLTTRQCLMNVNRHTGENPISERDVELRLNEALGVRKIIWIDEGLLNDHTDGHIDNLVRFVGPSKVVCMQAHSNDDPNKRVLEKIYQELCAASDASGKKLSVLQIPSPGLVVDAEGLIIPASYMNFYISNQTVIVPVYGTPFDHDAVASIASLFPERKTVGLPSKAILSGGGSFHCITQQEPA